MATTVTLSMARVASSAVLPHAWATPKHLVLARAVLSVKPRALNQHIVPHVACCLRVVEVPVCLCSEQAYTATLEDEGSAHHQRAFDRYFSSLSGCTMSSRPHGRASAPQSQLSHPLLHNLHAFCEGCGELFTAQAAK